MRFRPDTNDEEIWQSVTTGNEYGLPARFLGDDVVVDIGAHIGSFAYEVLHRGAGKVAAFEADVANCQLASQNLGEFGDRASLRWGAVCRSDAAVECLYFGGYERWPDRWNTGGGGVLWETAGQRVPAISFDSIIDQLTRRGRRRIRLVKLDCEESEWPILFTSRRLHLVDEIIGEYHEIGGQFDGRSIPPPAAVGRYERFTATELEQFLTAQGFDTRIVGTSRLGKFFARRRRLDVPSRLPQDVQYEVAFLAVARLFRPVRILEIGTLTGRSLVWLVVGSGQVELVMSIDDESYVPNSQVIAEEVLLDFGYGGSRQFIHGNSRVAETAAAVRAHHFDFAHVDGDHTYDGCRCDLALAWSVLEPYGVLFVHDHAIPDVRRATEDFARHVGVSLLVLPASRMLFGAMILQRPGA